MSSMRWTSARFEERPRRSRRAADAERRLVLRCDPDAPAAARDALRELDLRSRLDDAMLVASELVSNAVRHSGCGRDELLKVSAKLRRNRLLITVVDPGRSGATARRCADGDPAGGFGLRLVDQLAERWGSERSTGYRVWAELALSAPEPAQA